MTTTAAFHMVTGIPFASTTFNASTSTFTLASTTNYTNLFAAGYLVTVTGTSTSNDGYYQIVSSTYTSSHTVVTVESYNVNTSYPGTVPFVSSGTGRVILFNATGSVSMPGWVETDGDVNLLYASEFTSIAAETGANNAATTDSFTTSTSSDGGDTWTYQGLATIAGSVASGAFQSMETINQSVSGASATLYSYTGSQLTVIAPSINGTPDATDTWTGSLSSATFTPTATPTGGAPAFQYISWTGSQYLGFTATDTPPLVYYSSNGSSWTAASGIPAYIDAYAFDDNGGSLALIQDYGETTVAGNISNATTTLTAGFAAPYLTGYGTNEWFAGGFGSVSNANTSIGLLSGVFYDSATSPNFWISIDGAGLTQSSFTSVSWTDNNGSHTLNTSSATFASGNPAVWKWTLPAGGFTSGTQYTLTFTGLTFAFTTGTFVPGNKAPIAQNVTGACASLLSYSSTQLVFQASTLQFGPGNIAPDATDVWEQIVITGNRGRGNFILTETVTQTTSGATAEYVGIDDNGYIYVINISGTPDATDTWVGNSSSASFTPTATPAITATFTPTAAPAQSSANVSLWVMKDGNTGFTQAINTAPGPNNGLTGTPFLQSNQPSYNGIWLLPYVDYNAAPPSLWQSTNGGTSWTSISTPMFAGNANPTAVYQVGWNGSVWCVFAYGDFAGDYGFFTATTPGTWTQQNGDYPITAVAAGSHGTFSISGNYTANFAAGITFTVINDGSNNGAYTVQSSTFTGGNTVITVTGSIPSGTVSGNIINWPFGNSLLNANGWVAGSSFIATDGTDFAASTNGGVSWTISNPVGVTSNNGLKTVGGVTYLFGNAPTFNDLWSTSDGITWTRANLPNCGQATDVTNNGASVLLAAGDRLDDGSGAIWKYETSPPSALWPLAVLDTNYMGSATSAASLDTSHAVVAAILDTIYTSNGGTSWSVATSNTPVAGGTWYTMAAGAGKYVGTFSLAGTGYLATSTDGASWTNVTPGGANPTVQSLFWSATLSKFIVFDSVANSVWTSSNGTSWTQITLSGANPLFPTQIIDSGSRVVVVGSNNNDNGMDQTYATTDGVTWTPNSNTFGTSAVTTDADGLSGVAWNGTKFLTFGLASNGLTNFVYTSTDGIAWSQTSSSTGNTPPFLNASLVAALGTTFVIGYNTASVPVSFDIGTSTDGVTWATKTVSQPFDPNQNFVTPINGQSLMLSSGGTLYMGGNQGIITTSNLSSFTYELTYGVIEGSIFAGNGFILALGLEGYTAVWMRT